MGSFIRFCGLIGLFFIQSLYAQDANVKIKLKTFSGGVHPNISITITSNSTGKVYKAKSNAEGIAQITIPSNDKYTIKPANYSGNHTISLPNSPINYTTGITYNKDDLSNAKKFEPNEKEKLEIQKFGKAQPNINVLIGKKIDFSKDDKMLSKFTLTVKDLYGKPLPSEELVLTGRNYKKAYIHKTGKNGVCRFLLPKGEIYDLHFKQDSFYSYVTVKASTGFKKQSMTLSYIGTVELERRAKEKAKRIAEELERTKRRAKEYAEWLEKHKDDAIKERKKMVDKFVKGNSSFRDPVISKVFKRNKWPNKLIVADVTGSMHPYTKQLQAWFILNHMKETNLQYTFFNDGDGKSTKEKVIGSTGGIYYFPARGIDSLFTDVIKVTRAGGGGDVAENNIEALLYAIAHAKQNYKNIVMIADNHAPIKDISLLSKLNKPVHVILCGVGSSIEEDYLNLAFHSGGTVHTMEEDIINLAKMANGQTITIHGLDYKLLNGKFYALLKT